MIVQLALPACDAAVVPLFAYPVGHAVQAEAPAFEYLLSPHTAGHAELALVP